MNEPRRDPITLQREIASARSDLALDLEHLRAAIRRRLSLRAQLRAHPAIAFGIGVLLSVPLLLLAFATRARSARVQRSHWLPRP